MGTTEREQLFRQTRGRYYRMGLAMGLVVGLVFGLIIGGLIGYHLGSDRIIVIPLEEGTRI